MVQTIDAIFDVMAFQPAEPVALDPNTRVRVTIESLPEPATEGASFLRTARVLRLEGPADCSTRIEEYLHDQAGGGDCHPLPCYCIRDCLVSHDGLLPSAGHRPLTANVEEYALPRRGA